MTTAWKDGCGGAVAEENSYGSFSYNEIKFYMSDKLCLNEKAREVEVMGNMGVIVF